LASQPFSVLLGAQLTLFEPGVAELSMPIRRELLQQHGFVHGRVISYAIDNLILVMPGAGHLRTA